jgi:hypothetical protein
VNEKNLALLDRTHNVEFAIAVENPTEFIALSLKTLANREESDAGEFCSA